MKKSEWPKPWYTDPWQWVLVGYGGASAAFVVWIVFRPWLVGLNTQHWISMFSGLASFAVASAAFWLGLQNAIRDRSEKIVKANLAAAQAEVTITAALTRFQLIEATSVFRNLDDPRPKWPMEAMMNAFQAPIVAVDRDSLSLLVPLRAHCATRIARAFSLLDQVQRETQAIAGRWLTDQLTEPEQEHHLFRWNAALSEAVRLLSVTQRECQRAALEGAPPPTGEELWGNETP